MQQEEEKDASKKVEADIKGKEEAKELPKV
jgi:hypothetical protein